MLATTKRNRRLGWVALAALLLAALPLLAQYDATLQYQNRGDRWEGVKPKPVGGNDIELPSALVEYREAGSRAALEGWGVRLGGRDPIPAPPPPAPVACLPGQTDTVGGIVYVRICPGTFTMGSADNVPAFGNEKPAHQVTLSEEFWLGQTEVTNEQYRRIQPKQEGADKLPAVNVSWTEAKAACERFGGRLPTEAEWEYAARAGSTAAWSFGGDEKMLGDYAWYDKNAGVTAHPVATRKPNGWGLYDMHGNAWEWVADWYASYTAAAQRDPAGPATGESHVLRGGAFFIPAWGLRSADRDWNRPSFRDGGVGFRCARGPRRQP